MCTATLIPLPDGLRLAFNRDESPLRPAALPPQVRPFGTHLALMPIDPVSDGTWIAVSDACLVLALLNRNPTPPPDARFDASRGTIISSLLDCDHLASAKARLVALTKRRFAPFRLLLADRHEVIEFAYRDGDTSLTEHGRLERPLLFVSSGLGDEVVRQPRQQLFEAMFADDWATQQDLYHRHSWPDRRELSVSMRRDHARTVSYTVVELGSSTATLTYYPQAPDEPGPHQRVSLPCGN